MTQNRPETDAIPAPDLFAYRYPYGADPHEIRLHIDRKDGPLPTRWSLEYDRITSAFWYIRAAECGANCRCAAEAFRADTDANPTRKVTRK